MQIRIFTIPINDTGEAQAEMNRFLAGHRVLDVLQHFYQSGNNAYWSFCVRYILPGGSVAHHNSKVKTDYKLQLAEEQFKIFASLRICRKQLAAEDAVPAYAIFTDDELAGIAMLPILEPAKLIAVKGIGDKKVEKYGHRLLALYDAQKTNMNEEGEKSD
jgi:superfamily II DNA helicase RecQ